LDEVRDSEHAAQQRLEVLQAVVRATKEILILPHNDPDPDAIASALALRHLLAATLGIQSTIAYRGIIGRAENKALVHYLGRPLRRLKANHLASGVPVALVDTQPGAGNHPLPGDTVPHLVFDHHPLQEATANAPFADVRSGLGATSTILLEYLRAAGLEPSQPLATALFYGIKSDTMGLVRGAGPDDVAAYFYLQRLVDVEALVEIERAQVPSEYFRRLHAALHSARVYGNAVISYVGPMQRPDLAAEMADLLLRLDGVQWAVCMGAYEDDVIVAVRSRHPRGGAGHLVQAVVGDQGPAGGHDVMASGHVPVQGEEPEVIARRLEVEILRVLDLAEGQAGQALLEND
jgi:nanoRNase/pAp phosphatase (c-di-AMP/oligoRNAs hydrolase)